MFCVLDCEVKCICSVCCCGAEDKCPRVDSKDFQFNSVLLSFVLIVLQSAVLPGADWLIRQDAECYV